MRWMERSRGRCGSSGFLIPLTAAFGMLMVFSTLSLIAFIPKVVLGRFEERRHRRRLAEYQKRRAFFEARGWGWECN